MAEEQQVSVDKGNWFKRHKIATVILIIIGLIIVGSALSGGSSDNTTDNSSQSTETTDSDQPAEQASADTPKIGQAVRDGKFEFTVISFKCGEKTVGTSEYLQEAATGQFCRMNLTIKNIGDEAQSLFADNQKVFDSQDREYSYDSTATIYAAPSGTSGTWYDEINPGNSVTGDIIYDVPADVTPVRAELHDSAFSGGVKVSLQ